jgi:hypothetical protein
MYTEEQLDIVRMVLGTEEWRHFHRTSLAGYLQELSSIVNIYHTITGSRVYYQGYKNKCGAGDDVQLVFDTAYYLIMEEIIHKR